MLSAQAYSQKETLQISQIRKYCDRKAAKRPSGYRVKQPFHVRIKKYLVKEIQDNYEENLI